MAFQMGLEPWKIQINKWKVIQVKVMLQQLFFYLYVIHAEICVFFTTSNRYESKCQTWIYLND